MITAVWPDSLMERETKKEIERDDQLTESHQGHNRSDTSQSNRPNEVPSNLQQPRQMQQSPQAPGPFNMMPGLGQPMFEDLSFQFLENQYGHNLFRRPSQSSMTPLAKRPRTNFQGPRFLGSGFEEDSQFYGDFGYNLPFPHTPNYLPMGQQYPMPSRVQQKGPVAHSSKKKAGNSSKKGSVISPADRRCPSSSEIDFYFAQAGILQSLIAYNMQHLAFFPQSQWLTSFNNAVSSHATTGASRVTQELKKEMDPIGVEADFLEDFLIEPDNEMEPLMHLSYSNFNFQDPSQPAPIPTTERRRTTVSLVPRTHDRTKLLNEQSGSIIQLAEIMLPTLTQSTARDIGNLTTFQKSLARYKCREVLGFYKLMLKYQTQSKLQSAQMMENNSRFVVRTILNWGREYLENNGRFNKSKIGKHKRVTLFSDEKFQEALLEFAKEKGDDISVDNTSQFIREYHAQISNIHNDDELPSPPSSRATVHRWLKLLDIKLGPRGKKKSGK